jgi:hypothetical protein
MAMLRAYACHLGERLLDTRASTVADPADPLLLYDALPIHKNPPE